MAKKIEAPAPRRGRPPKAEADKSEKKPRLNMYWPSAEIRDWTERHIKAEQAAGRMPMRTEEGRQYGVTHLLFGLLADYRARVEKRAK